MIIDCISDLHGEYPTLKGGDLLIVAGDLTATHTEKEWHEFATWQDKQKYEKIIFIAGNHDTMIEKWDKGPVSDFNDRIEYLCDSGTEFEGLKIWGLPWTKTFPGMNPHCKAFTYDDENWFYDEKVSKIPNDVDVLITHAPPYGILDTVRKYSYGNPRDFDVVSLGSIALYNWLKYVGRPKLHVFGHIHEGYGQVEVFPTCNDKMMISVNASIMNGDYDPVNKPIRAIL